MSEVIRMEYTTLSRYLCLLPLHLSGAICLPNFYQRAWMEKVHKYVLQNIFLLAMFLIMFLAILNLFLVAVHDIFEFLSRLQELFLLLVFLSQLLPLKCRLDDVLELFRLQQILFQVSDTKIQRHYILKEYREIIILLILFSLPLLSFLLAPPLVRSNQGAEMLTTLYGNKYPHRVLPFIMWTPRSFDPSEMNNFIYLYISECFFATLLVVPYIAINIRVIIIMEPLEGQYKMLEKFIKLIGKKHEDVLGKRIFYTNIATGDYISESQMINR